jgi:hypothetical protein
MVRAFSHRARRVSSLTSARRADDAPHEEGSRMLALRRLVVASVSLVLMLALAAPASAAPSVTLEFWKAALTMEIQIGAPGGPIVKRKLKTNDVVNLALGQPLSTKVDKKTEVLALAGDASTPGPQSSVVVLNPSTLTITATVWTFSDFTLLNNADFSLNYVTADANVVATSLGTPAQNGFQASSIAVAGLGKHGGSGSLSVSSTALAGPVSFHENGTLVSGLMLKGKFKTGGGSLGAGIF